jgi:hypothetical protein
VPIAILLVLTSCLLVVVGARAVRAYQGARNEQRVRAGEKVGARPWMTIPYISQVYGVPEEELFGTLGLEPTGRRRRLPLQALARQDGRDLGADIAALNAALDARRATPGITTPPATPPRRP